MLNDTRNFLARLTFRKIKNLLKAELGFFLSKLFRKPIIIGLPYSYAIEPTSRCNLKCPQCPTGLGTIKRKKGEFSPYHYHNLVKEISGEAVYLMLYLQGEPYINPQIFHIIDFARKRNIYTCTSTNGHFLDKRNAEMTVLSGLDRIIISLDGTTQEVYQQYRVGGSLQLVLAGITNLVEARKRLKSTTPAIILQFVVFRHNQHQIGDFKKLARRLKVDKAEIKTAQIYDFETDPSMIPDIDKYSRYRKVGEVYQLKRKLKNRCRRIFTTAAITNDGNLLSCCYDKDGNHAMGNIRTKTFKELWKDAAFQSFRHHLLKNRKGIEICRNCNE